MSACKVRNNIQDFANQVAKIINSPKELQAVLNTFREQAIKDIDADEDISQIIECLNGYIKHTTQNKNIQNLFKICKENILNYTKSKAERVVKDRSINKSSSTLIPIFDPLSNDKIFKELSNVLLSLGLESEFGLVTGKDDLNYSIQQYKEKLFQQIVSFLQKRSGLLDTKYSENLYNPNINYSIYKEVMETFHNFLNREYSLGQITKYQHSNIEHAAIVAFYVLNNFDDILDVTSGGIYSIDPKYKGCAESNMSKYDYKSDTLKQQDFYDGDHTHNAEGETSNKLFKRWVCSISNNQGQYLDVDTLTHLYSKLHEYRLELNPNKKWDDTKVNLAYQFFYKDFMTFTSAVGYAKQMEALKSMLQNQYLSTFLPINSKIMPLLEALVSFYDKVQSALSNPYLLKSQIKFIENTINMAGVFCSNVAQHRTSAKTCINRTEHTSETKTIAKRQPIKKELYDPILMALESHCENKQIMPYKSTTFITPNNRVGRITNLLDSRVRNFLAKYYGISMTDKKAWEIQTRSLAKFNELIKLLADSALEAQKKSKTKQDIASYLDKEWQDYLAHQPAWMEISTILLGDDPIINYKLYDLEMNQLPNFENENISNSLEDSLELVKGNDAFADNVLVKHRHALFSTEKKNFGGVKQVKWYQPTSSRHQFQYGVDMNGNPLTETGQNLTVIEQIDLMFNEDFFKGIIQNGVFTFQVNCNSDKKTIPLIHLNVLASLGDSGALIDMSPTELKALYMQQLNTYMDFIKKRLIEVWQKYVALHTQYGTINSVDDILSLFQKLRQDGVKKSQILTDFFKEGIDYDEDLTCCFDNDDNIYANPELFLCFTKAKPHIEQGFQDYLAGLDTYEPIMDIGFLFKDRNKTLAVLGNTVNGEFKLDFAKFKEELSVTPELISLLKIDGVDTEQVLFNIISQLYNTPLKAGIKLSDLAIKLKYTPNPTTNEERVINSLIEKQYYMGQIAQDAVVQLENKYSMFHPAKKSLYKFEGGSLIELQQAWQNDRIAIQRDISARYDASTKRNNSNVATSIKLVKNTRYGVGDICTVAAIEDLTQELPNTIGHTKKLDIIDGAGFTNGIYAILENNSFPNKKISGSKKFIGFHRDDATITQVKYADYEINNEMLRQVSEHPRNNVDMKMVFKKMNSKKIPFDYQTIRRSLFGANLYVQQGSIIYKFTDIAADGTITFTENNGNSPITTNVFDDEGKLTMYSLWQALGGEWSMSDNGEEILASNISMELCAEVLCDLTHNLGQDFKKEVVGKLLPKAVLKTGYKNPNSRNSWSDKTEFRTFEMASDAFGLQNDSTHAADGGKSPNPTQTITNISFNGKELGLTTEAHEALAKTIALGMQEAAREMGLDKIIQSGSSTTQNVYDLLTKKLLSSLESGVSISGATTMLLAIVNGKFGDAVVPVSAREFVYKIISDFLSIMNTKAIKSKTNGGALVYNPSQNIISIYELADGTRLTRKDILNEAIKSRKYTGLNPNEMIQAYLKANKHLFNKQITKISELNIGDKVLINGQLYDLCQPYSVNIDFSNPKNKAGIPTDGNKIGFEDVKVLMAQGIKIEKINIFGRDLQPFKYTWIEAGQSHNIWSEECVINCAKYTPGNPYYKWALKQNIETEESLADKYKQNLLQVRALLKKLKEGNGITDLQFKAGEQIIPKINRSIQGLGSATLYEIMQAKEEFFRAQLDTQYSATEKLDEVLSNQKQGIPGCYVIKDKFDVIINASTDMGQLRPEQINGKLYIVHGEEYIEVPEGVTYNIEKSKSGKEVITIFSPDMNPILSNNFRNSVVLSTQKLKKSTQNNLSSVVLLTPDWKTKLDALLNKKAKELYTSFILSNQSESLRIPTQSYQSFMAMETVAFMEGDTNDCYTNVWQSWFQGSDFDIDKNYTLLYNLNSNGTIATTTPFTSYESKETLEGSLDLPLPQNKLARAVIPGGVWTTQLDTEYPLLKQFFENYNGESIVQDWKDIIAANPNSAQLLYLELKKLLENSFTELPDALWELYTVHHYYKPSKKGYQNKIVRNIYKASSSIINMEYSVQPMSADPTRESYERVTGGGEKVLHSAQNPISKFQMQELNAVGKIQVGVYANGIKVVGTLQEYFNKYYQSVKNSNYRDPNKEFIFGPLEFKISDTETLKLGPFTTFGNCNVDEALLKELIDRVAPKLDDATRTLMWDKINSQENIADKLSIMISLATDNAKELLLGNIQSTPETANMFVALYALGVSTDDIIKISTAVFKPIIDKQKSQNRLRQRVDRDFLKGVEKYADKANKTALSQLYYFGQELTALGSFFGINQGISARWAEMENIQNKLNKVLDKQKELINKNQLGQIKTYKKDTSGNIISYSIVDMSNFSDYTSQPLDVYSFVNDVEVTDEYGNSILYRDLMIAYFNNAKTAVNVLDVIASTPHFFEMYKALSETVQTTRLVIGRVGYVEYANQNSAKIGQENKSKIDILTTTTDGKEDTSESRSNKAKQAMLSDQIDIFDHYIVGKTLERLDKYYFTIKDLKSKLKIEYDIELSELDNYPDDYVLTLTSKEGINLFMQVMDNIISKLKERFPDNGFLREMQFKDKAYDLRFSFFDSNADSETIKLRQTEIEDGFNSIKDLNSQIINMSGQGLYFGELLYLYNMIAHKNKIGRLNKFVCQMSESYGNPILETYTKVINEIDNKYISIMKELQEQKRLDPTFNIWTSDRWEELDFDILLDLSAISKTQYQEGTTRNGDYYDLQDSYIYTVPTILSEYQNWSVHSLAQKFPNEIKITPHATPGKFTIKINDEISTKLYNEILTPQECFDIIKQIENNVWGIDSIIEADYNVDNVQTIDKNNVFIGWGSNFRDVLTECLNVPNLVIKTIPGDVKLCNFTHINGLPILIMSHDFLLALKNDPEIYNNIEIVNTFLNAATDFGDLEAKLEVLKRIPNTDPAKVYNPLKAYLDHKAHLSYNHINQTLKKIIHQFHEKVTTFKYQYYSSKPKVKDIKDLYKYDIITFTRLGEEQQGLYLGKFNNIDLIYNINTQNIEELTDFIKNTTFKVEENIIPIDESTETVIDPQQYVITPYEKKKDFEQNTILRKGDKIIIDNNSYWVTQVYVADGVYRYVCQMGHRVQIFTQQDLLDKNTKFYEGSRKYNLTSTNDKYTYAFHERASYAKDLIRELQIGDTINFSINGQTISGKLITNNNTNILTVVGNDQTVYTVSLDQILSVQTEGQIKLTDLSLKRAPYDRNPIYTITEKNKPFIVDNLQIGDVIDIWGQYEGWERKDIAQFGQRYVNVVNMLLGKNTNKANEHAVFKIVHIDGDYFYLQNSKTDEDQIIIISKQDVIKNLYKAYLQDYDTASKINYNVDENYNIFSDKSEDSFLTSLSNAFGDIPIKFVEADPNLPNAKGWTDGKTIFLVKSLSGNTLKETALHELRHLVLAYIRANSPDTYFQLINNVKSDKGFATMEEAEEFIVSTSPAQMPNSIAQYIISWCSALVGGYGQQLDTEIRELLNRNIQSIINIKTIKQLTNPSLTMKESMKWVTWMDNIKYEC